MKVAQDDYFVGRQPILDSQSKIYGYELLFRGGLTPTTAEFDSACSATATVIRNAMMNVGLTALVGDAKAFINFPEEFFLEAQEPIFSSCTNRYRSVGGRYSHRTSCCEH
jgi:EAL and modified HD-GYP domain-containing signal transduction protein